MVGLLVAGILKQLVPSDFVSKNIGERSTSSVMKAALFGIPLPVCSCSAIPLAQGLKKEGASKGAVLSFLISAPITGADSILATFSFFGLIFTVFRVISSTIIAILVGLIQNFVEDEEPKEGIFNSMVFTTYAPTNNTLFSQGFKKEKSGTSSCCDSFRSSNLGKKRAFSIKATFFYGYVTLLKDIAKPLFVGLLFGAIVTSFIPKEYSSLLFENQFLTYFFILIIAIPLYVCATASLPIAAAFMIKGMSVGAAFIFLTAGPATSAVTMSVVYKMLGKKSLIVYVSTISILALIFGTGFDYFEGHLDILDVSSYSKEVGIINKITSGLLLFLILYYLLKPMFIKEKGCHK